MSTQFHNADGQHLATRFAGNNDRGLCLQFECFEAEFKDEQCYGDDGSETTLTELRDSADTTLYLTPFTLNSRANDMKKMAARWSSHPGLAHQFAMEAQDMKCQARTAMRRR